MGGKVVICTFLAMFAVLALPLGASAQGPVEDGGGAPFAPAFSSAPAAPVAPAAPERTPASSSAPAAPERPARGPAVRERGGRRTRAGSAASGALMLTMLIGILGYYVVKRLRR